VKYHMWKKYVRKLFPGSLNSIIEAA